MDGITMKIEEKEGTGTKEAQLTKLLSCLAECDGYVVIMLTSDVETTGGFTTELRTSLLKDTVPELLKFVVAQMQ